MGPFSTFTRPRRRLAAMSRRKLDEWPAREACRKAVLARDDWRCRVCGEHADDVHEILTRARGGSPTDPDNCAALCRDCHDVAHRNPNWATEAGLMLSQFPGRNKPKH